MSEPFAHVEPEAEAFSIPPAPAVFHEYANLFPMLEGEAYKALVADIREHGVHEPVVMYEGKILDGRNRYCAAREAGRSWPVVQYDGADPLAYVISLNLTRRHLTEPQRAVAARRIATLQQGARTDLPPIGGKLISQERAAELMNVSLRSVERASVVLEHGTPALVAMVEAGQVSVSAAAEVARLPELAQTDIVYDGPASVQRAAKAARAAKPAAAQAPAEPPDAAREVASLSARILQLVQRDSVGVGASPAGTALLRAAHAALGEALEALPPSEGRS